MNDSSIHLTRWITCACSDWRLGGIVERGDGGVIRMMVDDFK